MDFEETFCKSCHHDYDVIANEQFAMSNWIVKKYPFLSYVEKDIFWGKFVSWKFQRQAGVNERRRENTFEDIFDFDIKNMV